MSWSLGDIREAVADTIATADIGLRAYAYVPDLPQPPCVVVAVDSIDYHTALGAAEIALSLTVVGPRTSDRDGQRRMDVWLSHGAGGGVADALGVGAPGVTGFGGRAWLGAGRLELAQRPSSLTVGDVEFFAAELRFTMTARRI